MYAGKHTQKYSKGDKETVCTHFRVNLHSVVAWMCEGAPCSKQTQYLSLKWLQRGSNPQPLSQQFSQNSQMVKWLNFSKWLSVLYKLEVFIDWNTVAMTARGGDKRTD